MEQTAGSGPRAPHVAALLSFVAVIGLYVGAMQLDPPAVATIDERESTVKEVFSAPGAPSIVYVGSSAALENSPEASDRRTLADFFALHLGIDADRVLLMASFGFHPRVYKAVVEALVQLPYRPRVVVVPIEMRVFSAGWYGLEHARYDDLIDSLERREPSPVDRGLRALHLTPRQEVADWFVFTPHRVRSQAGPPVQVYGRETMTFQDYQALLVSDVLGGRYVGTDPVARTEKVEIQLRANYLYDMDERHSFLRSLVDLGRLARSNGIDVVFYVAPVDVEDLETWCGPDSARLGANVRLVVETLRKAGEGRVLDISRLLPAAMFADKRYSCEHLSAEGRSLRAKAVADYLRAEGLATD